MTTEKTGGVAEAAEAYIAQARALEPISAASEALKALDTSVAAQAQQLAASRALAQAFGGASSIAELQHQTALGAATQAARDAAAAAAAYGSLIDSGYRDLTALKAASLGVPFSILLDGQPRGAPDPISVVGRAMRDIAGADPPPTPVASPPTDGVSVETVSDLANAIRTRRVQLNMSQQILAQRAGVGRRFVSELESGKLTCELGRALAVCAVLGLKLRVS